MATFNIAYDYNNNAIDKNGQIIRPDRETIVHIVVRHNSLPPRLFKTGVKVTPKYWDEEKKAVKKSHPDSVDFNLRIQETRAFLTKQYTDSIRESGFWDPSKAKAHPSEIKSKPKILYFDVYWEEWLNSQRQYKAENPNDENLLSPITLNMSSSGLNRLREFRTNIHWKSITSEFMTEYEDFLNKYRYKLQGVWKPLKPTRKKDLIKLFKIVYKHAIRDKFIPRNENIFDIEFVSQFRGAKSEASRDLDPHEINKFITLEIPDDKPYWKKLRDGFVIMCMTGLGPGDLADVDDSWVVKNGQHVNLKDKRNKTKVKIDLPVSLLFDGKPWEILSNYISPGVKPWDVTNQHFNREIKKIAALAGIHKPGEITLYVGRHTFANLLIDAGLELPIIQKLMAHTKISSTLIYAKYNARAVKRAVEQVEWVQVMSTEESSLGWKSFVRWVESFCIDVIPVTSHRAYFPKIHQAIISWQQNNTPCTLIILEGTPENTELHGNVSCFYRFAEGHRRMFKYQEANQPATTYADIPKDSTPEEVNYLATKYLRGQLIKGGQLALQVG